MAILASAGSFSLLTRALIVLSVTALRPNQVHAAFLINKSRGVLFGAARARGQESAAMGGVLKLN
jgi:hypothetical protein